ncbi:hypothetical protein CDL15_Pgr009981 [Punica granatum]|uniref:glutathione transferase n=1 Tax=Punica granatum TaxID=22663 RepID=A0A218X509_PUNGR|nr:hypothetical protein CDL15_Pgr009981 [Punica granatum]PKI36064.1 hypothetical protein CRG98_043535 [Punica granatum]
MEEEGEDVKLLGAWPSPFSYRVLWGLKLKGISFQYEEEDLARKSSALLRYNPVHRKIPVLVHGEKPIAESTVILEYIEEAWPQKNDHPLLPQDPLERAEARFWTKFVEDKNPTFFRYFRSTGVDQEQATEEAKQVLKAIEDYAELQIGKEGKKFFRGGTIGITDLTLGWISWWLKAMEEAVGVKLLMETTDEAEEGPFPNLSRWMKNFREDPVIRDNLPDFDDLVLYFKRLRHNFIATSD